MLQRPRQVGDDQKRLRLTLPAVRASVPEARHAVADFARACLSDPLVVTTAVSEAVGNAVMHAYRDVVPPGDVRIDGHRDGSGLVVTVSDDGVGMRPNLQSEGLGIGSTMIAAMSGEVTYDSPGRGVRVTMRFPCAEPALARH